MRTWWPLLLASACAPSAPAPAERPNIVLLIADDMDYEHFGFAGHPLAVTPNLDALAEQGVVFTHGFAPVSRCRPAQAALLTGRWPHQNGIYFNVGEKHIDPTDALPNHLARAGYATRGEGKFWERDPRLMGFSNEAIVNYETFVRAGQAELFAFLDSHAAAQPFFVWWAPQLPHVPHDPPRRLLERIPRERIRVPPWLASDGARREKFLERERALLAMGAWLDEGVGELVAKLRALGTYENTLFVFLIDNGWANGCVSKGWGLDKGLRTPVIFAWPRGLAGPRTFADLVSPVDVYATILDYAGAPIPAGCQGTSLRPRIEGKAAGGREALYGALYPYAPTAPAPDPARDAYGLWARTARWKYVLTLRDVRRERGSEGAARGENPAENVYAVLVPSFERRRGDEELYDLEADPYEQANLAALPEHAGLKAQLRRDALAWWAATGGAPLDVP